MKPLKERQEEFRLYQNKVYRRMTRKKRELGLCINSGCIREPEEDGTRCERHSRFNRLNALTFQARKANPRIRGT